MDFLICIKYHLHNNITILELYSITQCLQENTFKKITPSLICIHPVYIYVNK